MFTPLPWLLRSSSICWWILVNNDHSRDWMLFRFNSYASHCDGPFYADNPSDILLRTLKCIVSWRRTRKLSSRSEFFLLMYPLDDNTFSATYSHIFYLFHISYNVDIAGQESVKKATTSSCWRFCQAQELYQPEIWGMRIVSCFALVLMPIFVLLLYLVLNIFCSSIAAISPVD